MKKTRYTTLLLSEGWRSIVSPSLALRGTLLYQDRFDSKIASSYSQILITRSFQTHVLCTDYFHSFSICYVCIKCIVATSRYKVLPTQCTFCQLIQFHPKESNTHNITNPITAPSSRSAHRKSHSSTPHPPLHHPPSPQPASPPPHTTLQYCPAHTHH